MLKFMNFITATAARDAQMVNCKGISDDCGIDQVTAKNWLHILETLGIIFYEKLQERGPGSVPVLLPGQGRKGNRPPDGRGRIAVPDRDQKDDGAGQAAGPRLRRHRQVPARAGNRCSSLHGGKAGVFDRDNLIVPIILI